jgi:hypothetical protein
VTQFLPIAGMTCDETHPYPSPEGADWVDSMEFGDDRRLGEGLMYDRDTTPAWRAVAAYQWGAPCLPQHVEAVAADPILTAYMIAAAAMSLTDTDLGAPWRYGFSEDGAGRVIAALRKGGAEAARAAVDQLSAQARVTAVEQAVTFFNDRFTAMRLDVAGRFHS